MSATDFDPLLGDFDAASNVTLGVVFAKVIIVQLFVVSRFVVFCGFACDSIVSDDVYGFWPP